MAVKNGKHKIVGFVELGEAHDHMEKILGETNIWRQTNLFSHTSINNI